MRHLKEKTLWYKVTAKLPDWLTLNERHVNKIRRFKQEQISPKRHSMNDVILFSFAKVERYSRRARKIYDNIHSFTLAGHRHCFHIALIPIEHIQIGWITQYTNFEVLSFQYLSSAHKETDLNRKKNTNGYVDAWYILANNNNKCCRFGSLSTFHIEFIQKTIYLNQNGLWLIYSTKRLIWFTQSTEYLYYACLFIFHWNLFFSSQSIRFVWLIFLKSVCLCTDCRRNVILCVQLLAGNTKNKAQLVDKYKIEHCNGYDNGLKKLLYFWWIFVKTKIEVDFFHRINSEQSSNRIDCYEEFYSKITYIQSINPSSHARID